MTIVEEMLDFYHKNKDFKDFIDDNMRTYNKTLNYMLSTKTAEIYYQSLLKGGCNESNK